MWVFRCCEVTMPPTIGAWQIIKEGFDLQATDIYSYYFACLSQKELVEFQRACC